MLELKPCCEHCGHLLPPGSTEAFICSFECTFCRDCCAGLFKGVCPNCSGQLVLRPMRPAMHLVKYPSGHKPVTDV